MTRRAQPRSARTIIDANSETIDQGMADLDRLLADLDRPGPGAMMPYLPPARPSLHYGGGPPLPPDDDDDDGGGGGGGGGGDGGGLFGDLAYLAGTALAITGMAYVAGRINDRQDARPRKRSRRRRED